MRDKRYRLVYGESHEDVRIADDKGRCYLFGYQVDRLNEYDEKTEVMESKLNELGFELVFIRETWDKDKDLNQSLLSILILMITENGKSYQLQNIINTNLKEEN